MPGGRPLSATSALHRVAIDGPAEAVHRLGGIREHPPALPAARAPAASAASTSSGDQNGMAERVASHASQREQRLRAREVRLVGDLQGALARRAPRHAGCRARSHSAASSVACTRSRVRARGARARSSRAGIPAASARARVARDPPCARSRRSSSTSLSVSTTGKRRDGAHALRARSRRRGRSSPLSTNGRAASCTSTICASSGRSSSPLRTDSPRSRPPTDTSSRSTSHWKSHGGGSPAYRWGSTHTTIATSGRAMKRLQRVQQHRLARDPPELLEFRRPPARVPLPAATMTTPTSRATSLM